MKTQVLKPINIDDVHFRRGNKTNSAGTESKTGIKEREGLVKLAIDAGYKLVKREDDNDN